MMRILPLLWVGWSVVGCAELRTEWAYRKVALGVTPIETLGRVLPDSATRTTHGFAALEETRWPETTAALVVLEDAGGKVGCKLLLTLQAQRLGGIGRRRVVLTGELAGSTNAGTQRGPVARLTEVLGRLGGAQHKPDADRAYQLVGASIIRLLESLPDAPPAQTAYQRFAETLSRIPANGTVTLTNASPTTYRVTYRAAGGPQ